MKVACVVITVCVLILAGCGRKHRAARTPNPPVPAKGANATAKARAPQPAALPSGYIEQGLASWYGVPYHGRAAADGEIYDMETMVAAHRVMPFNTWLRVTNLQNNKSVEVRIIDRGPFVDGRIIDLSKAAARQIDLLGPGVAQVRLEVISSPSPPATSDFYAVQVGAFSVYENAERARAFYAAKFTTARLAVKQGNSKLWRVLVGKEPSIEAAQQLAEVISPGNTNVFVVRLDSETTPGNVSDTAPARPPVAAPAIPDHPEVAVQPPHLFE